VLPPHNPNRETRSLLCSLGINAVYHLTELPSVVSGWNIMYLDPQSPGTMSEFAASKPFPNQYEPYRVFGFNIEVRALLTSAPHCLPASPVGMLTRVRRAVRVLRGIFQAHCFDCRFEIPLKATPASCPSRCTPSTR